MLLLDVVVTIPWLSRSMPKLDEPNTAFHQSTGNKALFRMDAGTVWVNKHADLDPGIPFGGAKQSGIGTELGREGLEEFTQRRVINIS